MAHVYKEKQYHLFRLAREEVMKDRVTEFKDLEAFERFSEEDLKDYHRGDFDKMAEEEKEAFTMFQQWKKPKSLRKPTKNDAPNKHDSVYVTIETEEEESLEVEDDEWKKGVTAFKKELLNNILEDQALTNQISSCYKGPQIAGWKEIAVKKYIDLMYKRLDKKPTTKIG